MRSYFAVLALTQLGFAINPTSVSQQVEANFMTQTIIQSSVGKEEGKEAIKYLSSTHGVDKLAKATYKDSTYVVVEAEDYNKIYNYDYRGTNMDGHFACGARVNGKYVDAKSISIKDNWNGLIGFTLIFCHLEDWNSQQEVVVAPSSEKKASAYWSNREKGMCDEGEFITSLIVRYQDKSIWHVNSGIDGLHFECKPLKAAGTTYPKKFAYGKDKGDIINLYDGSRGEWGTQFMTVNKKYTGKDETGTNYFGTKLIAGAMAESDIDTTKKAGWLGLTLVLKEPEVKEDPANTNNVVNGYWNLLNSGGDLVEEYSVSVSSSDSTKNAYKNTKSFELAGELNLTFSKAVGVKSSLKRTWVSEMNSEITKTLNEGETKTKTNTCKIDGVTNPALYQWVIEKGVKGKSSYFKVETRNIRCVKAGRENEPKCPPWYCKDDACSECTEDFKATK